MKLALKIDVPTLRGLREGVPALVELLQRHGAGATFFFAVGPDGGGRFGRSLLPGADLGRRGGDAMRRVRDAGFETGLLGWNVARWRRHVVHADAPWTEASLQKGVDEYRRIFGDAPPAHAAAGWQTNVHALRMTQRLGFAYCSDGRGHAPHLPVGNAELIRCPQIPTTLPLLDECMAAGIDVQSLASHVLAGTGEAALAHVFALRADVEALSLLPVVDQLLIGWKAQGYELVALAAILASVEPLALPRCEVALAPVAGRGPPVLLQGEEFLADVELPRAA
ncbi:MAG TPA: 4-deoxy-4-formamido-L-arabinose-phosphoundecaprenol deformylase [Casimicrobiaceae bacterium]|nr:4-deoxy-4-formamido-L-arabinose-phosphoundecaprenol deformylase [Casimicrobiaceae bacterium]